MQGTSAMTIRSRPLASSLGAALLAAAVGSRAATAGDLISPSGILSQKGPSRGRTGFPERTDRIRSLMGLKAGRSATRRIAVRPSSGRTTRRDADATAGLR